MTHHSLPKQLFFLSSITLISLTLYLDRGVIGAILPSIKAHFPQLTSLEQGLLGSSFLFGYMFSSLVFAELTSWVPVKYLMMCGCGIFVTANLLICLALSFVAPFSEYLPLISSSHSRFWFYYLLILRLFVSVGEAAIIPLSFSVVDDLMSNSLRTFAVTALSLILPVGIAIGFATSGIFHYLVGENWHHVFWVEVALMTLFGSTLVVFPSKMRRRVKEKRSSENTNVAKGMPSAAASGVDEDTASDSQPNVRKSHNDHQSATPKNDHKHGQEIELSEVDSAEMSITPPTPRDKKALSARKPPQKSARRKSFHGKLNVQVPKPWASGNTDFEPLGSGTSSVETSPVFLHDYSHAYDTPKTRAADGETDSETGAHSPLTLSVRDPALKRAQVSFDSLNDGQGSPSPLGDRPFFSRETSTTELLVGDLHTITSTPSIGDLLKMNEQTQEFSQQHTHDHHAYPAATDNTSNVAPEWDDNAIVDDAITISTHFQNEDEEVRKYTMCGALLNLFTNKMYLCICVSGITYTFVLGSFIFWGPSFIVEYLDMDLSEADLIFSVVALFTGVLGPLTTGIILQRLVSSKKEEAYNRRKKTAVSFMCSCVCIFIGAIAGMAGFILPPNRFVFFGAMTVSIFFLLAAQSPLNLILISCVPKGVRTHSMSVFIFLIHLLGDFPSPMGFGLLKDLTDILWAMRIFWVLLIATFFAYIFGAVFSLQELGQYKKKKQPVRAVV